MGIGTTSPTQKLTVEGADGSYLMTVQTSATNKPRFQVYIDDTNGVYLVSGYDTTAKPMRMTVGGSDRFMIKTTGQIQFSNYQTTTSFTGTLVGNLGFDASGNILTTGISVTGTGSGSASEGYAARWNGTTSITTSNIYEFGTTVYVGYDGSISNMAVNGKIFDTRIDPRSVTTTSTATLTPDVSTDDLFTVTAQAATITLANPTGTPVEGQKIIVRIKDNGTARSIQYGTQYRGSSELALPTTTTISKTIYLGFIYNSTDTKWDLVAKLDNFA